MTSDPKRRLGELLAEGFSCREAARELGVSPATAIRWTRREGLVSQRARQVKPEAREAVLDAMREGASCAEAARRFGLAWRTAARLADSAGLDRRHEEARRRVLTAVAGGASRRRAAAEAGVSVATAIRWARGPERRATGRSAQLRIEPAPPALRAPKIPPASRNAKRRQVLAAIHSGLSRRKAADLCGVPVATAIRWARDPDWK